MLLKKKIEGKKSENLKAEKKINLAQIRWFPIEHIFGSYMARAHIPRS